MNIAIYIRTEIAKKWVSTLQSNLKYQHIIFVCENLRELLDNVHSDCKFDLVLLEFNLIKEVLDFLKTQNPIIKIGGFGSQKKIEELSAFIKEGLVAYIDMEASVFELYNGLQFIQEGRHYFPGYMMDQLIQIHMQAASPILETASDSLTNEKDIGKKLTDKEILVFELLMKGQTYKEIAIILGISVFAVNQRVKYIYKKYKVRSRGELSFTVNLPDNK